MVATVHTSSLTALCQAFLILAVIIGVSAGPLSVQRRNALDIWSPDIVDPTANSTWTAGALETIIWDTTNAPNSISNQGDIVLKTIPSNSSEPSQWYHLAGPFKLTIGKVNVTVPQDVRPGWYAIILFGDSGNESPAFRINGVDKPDGHLGPHVNKTTPSGMSEGQLKRVPL